MSAIKQSVTGTGNIVLGDYTLTATATGTVYSTGNPQVNITGNAATVTTNANLTGVVTSVGNTTSIANGAITNAMLANAAVANLSGTNTGDNAVNSLYSGLVSNATHTGDVTGSTALTLATTQSAVHTWSATQTFSVAPVFTDASGTRTALGLGALSIVVPGANVATALAIAVGTNGSVLVQGGAIGTPSSGTLTNCTIPATQITGYVCGSYKRNGSSQTLTSATDVELIFPTSVKTSSAFAGTTFTAPATGYASAIGSFGLNCTASVGDTESGTVTVKIRDTNSNTDVIILVDAISVFFAGAGAVISNVYPILATIPVTSGHTYQVWVNWDNGGDDATTNNGSLTWEMKLA